MTIDMSSVRNIHMIGIGGCGMSGIAKILHELGFKVSGSDAKEGPNTIRLKDLGVKVYIGHDAANVRDADIVIYSSALSFENIEMQEAVAKGITILKRAEMLSWIMQQSQKRIAVAGTHGKTTTTAMLASVLDAAKLMPTYLIGCDMDYAEGNARLGTGRVVVAEADESDSSFLCLKPSIAIITNIEEDHMERFGTLAKLLVTFEEFAEKIPADGFIAVDATNLNNQKLMEKVTARYITYGLSGEVAFLGKNLRHDTFTSHYTLQHNSDEIGEVILSVPGWQNVLNSLPVFAVGFELGLDFNTISGALRSFIGARRRFQTVGTHQDILIIDDYAHHPTEIKATLAAAKAGWPRHRIICIFQPHRYSRTMILKDQFAQAFSDADKVIITDVYAASEKPLPGISGKTIVNAIQGKDVTYIPRKEKIPDHLLSEVRDGDMVLTLGAGDIYTVGKEILSRLKLKGADKLTINNFQ